MSGELHTVQRGSRAGREGKTLGWGKIVRRQGAAEKVGLMVGVEVEKVRGNKVYNIKVCA